MRKKTGGGFSKTAVSILLSFLLVALVMCGCSEPEPEPEPESDEPTHLTEEDAAYLTGDYLQFWQNEILPAQGRVSDGSWAFLPHGMGEPMIHTVGSAGAVVLDADGDGNDEMLHVFLQDNSEMGESYAYSVGVSLVAEVFENDGNTIYLSDSFILSECVGWMVDSVQVFLSEHDGKTYICMEQICQPIFPDALSVADYVICEYDGSQITLCREVYDPGFSSGKGLYAGRDYIECLFLEEPGFENTGKYDSYELALRSELEPFGISIDYINDTEYSARLSDKTQMFSFESVCSYDYETDVLYGSRVTVAAHTFPDDALSNPLYAEPEKDPGDAPEIEDQEQTSEPEVEAQTAEYRWFVKPSVTADDINVIRRIRPVYTGAGVFDLDFNTNGMPVCDRIAQVERDGKFGLISYSGLPLSDVMFDDIYVGYDDRYGMETYGDEYMCYTLTSLNELSKLKEGEVFDITGSAPNPFLCWIESTGTLVATGADGLDADYESDYMGTSAAHWCADEDSFDEFVHKKYVVVSGGKRVNDEYYEAAGHYSDGIIPVKKNGKWGYINAQGETVIPFELDGIWSTGMFYWNTGEEIIAAYDASCGYVAVCKDGKYGMLDTSGRQIIAYGEFDAIRPVYDGLFWAKKDGKWGVVSLTESPSLFQTVPPEEYVKEKNVRVNTKSGLRMREGPGVDYCVVGVLSNNREVVLCGQTNEWSYIRVNGVYGWVHSDYLK